MNKQKALRLSNISKSFSLNSADVSVLKSVSFEADAGDASTILGPSGSGKSTLLHIIGTLEPPSSGQVEINGTDSTQMTEVEIAKLRNDTIGFVFQDHHLLPQYSVLENVLLPVLAFSKINSDHTKLAKKLIEQVELSHRLNHRPSELSGGEKQRVAIARAMINNPAILLCDEPTGNLDSKTAETISELVFDLHKELNNILITVTHSTELANRFPIKYSLLDGSLTKRD